MKEPRQVPIAIDRQTFRDLGHRLVDRIAELFDTIGDRPVTPGEPPSTVRSLLGTRPIPHSPVPAQQAFDEITDVLIDHSLYIGHPRFWGYITTPAAPIGVLGDLLASAVNPNVGSFILSPVGTEVERQVIRWIAELIGYPTDSGGILVSGGNMANFIGFLAGRRAKLPWDVRKAGFPGGTAAAVVYVSAETHTWIQKAADLFGLGTDAIRWIETDDRQRMRIDRLREAIAADRNSGRLPLMVVGSAGTVGTGAVDPLKEIAGVAREHSLWYHIDGAYGGLAACLPDAPPDLRSLGLADSVAVDPHKWLYAPMECGCALVRDPAALTAAFSYHPSYYRFGGEEEPTNFFELGMQNSRGFRALKVWLSLRQAGREGYIRLISDDIALSREMEKALRANPEIEVFTQNLSICTFRYRPSGPGTAGQAVDEDYLNKLNSAILASIQEGGKAFVSNCVLGGRMLLRACIVNFRTSVEDVRALPGIVADYGRSIHARAGLPGD